MVRILGPHPSDPGSSPGDGILHHVYIVCADTCDQSILVAALLSQRWPVGLMDKASASGAGDSRLESWVGRAMQCGHATIAGDV